MLDDNANVTSCTKCPNLVECRSQIVNGTGPIDADIIFVGEAPGANEDEQGEPFVGRSGSLLDEVLEQYDTAREDVRITNCVRCRPPENRDPTDDELENCRPYLEAEIATVEPEVVVGLGRVPSEHLTGRDLAVTKEAGDVYTKTFDGYQTTVMVGLHPAFILRDGSYRETFESVIDEATRIAFDRGTDLDDFL